MDQFPSKLIKCSSNSLDCKTQNYIKKHAYFDDLNT